MNDSPTNITATSLPGRRLRSWLRSMSQFSLRTLLAMTTLAAVLCWWFLRPKVMGEELAGPPLKVRRQVRAIERDAQALGQSENAQEVWANVGSWQLFGKNNQRLPRGLL